jgi:hypothetical protein
MTLTCALPSATRQTPTGPAAALSVPSAKNASANGNLISTSPQPDDNAQLGLMFAEGATICESFVNKSPKRALRRLTAR